VSEKSVVDVTEKSAAGGSSLERIVELENKVRQLEMEGKSSFGFLNYLFKYFTSDSPITTTPEATTTAPTTRSTTSATPMTTKSTYSMRSEKGICLYFETKEFKELPQCLEQYISPVGVIEGSLPFNPKLVLYVVFSGADRPTVDWDNFRKVKAAAGGNKTAVLILRYGDNDKCLNGWSPEPSGDEEIKLFKDSVIGNKCIAFSLLYLNDYKIKKNRLVDCDFNSNQIHNIKRYV